MQIEVIDTLERLRASRATWEAVYDADPEAQVFLSFAWMAHWLASIKGPWFILAARPSPGASPVAFFPLRLRTKQSAEIGFFNEINMAGNYAADYTGFICRPEHAARAIAALGRHLRHMHWARIHLENVRASKARLDLLLAAFPERGFTVTALDRTNRPENVDNLVCPYIALPESFEAYLQGALSTNTRQRLRRAMRQVEDNPDYRITFSDAASLDGDIDLLLDLWAQRWGTRKGGRLGAIIASNRNMLRFSFTTDTLQLLVMRKGERPVCAIAILVDRRKQALHFYIGGRDDSFEGPPAGLVLHAYAIRHAIESGFRTYDFLRGNEPYKYSLGAQEHHISCLAVTTRDGRNAGDLLDRRSVRIVFDMAADLCRAGKTDMAARGYRQMLAVEPDNAGALYCLAQIEAAQGNHLEAVALYRRLVRQKATPDKVLTRLAAALEALGRRAEAAQVRSRLATEAEPPSPPLPPIRIEQPEPLH